MSARAPQDHTLPILAVTLFVLNSPLTDWWSKLALPWYALFILWGIVIALVGLNQWRLRHGRARRR